MNKNNRNNEQIYGRNDMIMLDQNNKIYGSLGIADNYVMKTEEGTRLVLRNPKLGRFGDVLTEFNMYGKSEQKQYKGINLLPPDINYRECVEVSIPKGSLVFWVTDGIPAKGGNFRFFNEDKTENMWFEIDSGTTSARMSLTIDAKYVQNLIGVDFDLSKICLGVGNEPIYEPYTGGIPSPSPDYPQEIKRVVNPTMKVCGKNLWDNFKTLSLGNVEQKNGTYIATADTMQVDITSISIGARPLLLKANNAYTFSLKTTVSISSPKFVCLRYTNGESNNIIFTNKNFVNFVPERDVEKIGFILYESVAGDKAYDVQLEMGSEATSYEPYTEQSVQLPYTLNAISVASGGNVTIDGQQYIADYIDVGRGKLVKTIYEYVFSGKERWIVANDGAKYIEHSIIGDNGIMDSGKYKKCLCSCLIASTMYETRNGENHISTQVYSNGGIEYNNRVWVSSNVVTSKLVGEKAFLALAVPKEISLTQEEIEQYKKLSIKIPVTIIENNYNTWMKATYKSIESA